VTGAGGLNNGSRCDTIGVKARIVGRRVDSAQVAKGRVKALPFVFRAAHRLLRGCLPQR
jgi:hypothetical protein